MLSEFTTYQNMLKCIEKNCKCCVQLRNEQIIKEIEELERTYDENKEQLKSIISKIKSLTSQKDNLDDTLDATKQKLIKQNIKNIKKECNNIKKQKFNQKTLQLFKEGNSLKNFCEELKQYHIERRRRIRTTN